MSRSCVILGAGRSGTSLVGGLFRKSGYYMGSDPVTPTVSNPTGYFEDREINGINEDLIQRIQKDLPGQRVISRLPRALQRNLPIYSARPARTQLWLAVPSGFVTAEDRGDVLTARMTAHANERPFCFKDPRFVHTLPAWADLFPDDVVHVCVFRNPLETVASMHEDRRTQPYLQSLRLTDEMAFQVWLRAYENCLRMSERGTWVFVHYEDVLSGQAVDVIEAAVGVDLDRTIARPDLHRSIPQGDLPADVAVVYEQLLARRGDI